jgi:hypothetical protein
MSIEDLDDLQTFKLFVTNLSWLNKRDLKWSGVGFAWRNLLRQRSNDWTAEDGASAREARKARKKAEAGMFGL